MHIEDVYDMSLVHLQYFFQLQRQPLRDIHRTNYTRGLIFQKWAKNEKIANVPIQNMCICGSRR